VEKTVVKAFKTLEVLAASPEPQGITALSEALGMGKSNVHRMLATLASMGYVRPVGGGLYEATLRLWEQGTQVLMRNDTRRIASPHLGQLVRATGETAHLSVLDGAEVMYVDKIDGDHPVRAYTRVGARAPAHAVATGKALLAYQPAEAIDAYAASMQSFTPRTVSSRKALIQALQDVRKSGVAFNLGEWREGVCGVAAPIRDSQGAVVAAMGISGPAERFKPKDMKRFAPIVVDASARVSRELGFLGHTPATA
jgi:IclR family KDG regulon transcriptional repressor